MKVFLITQGQDIGGQNARIAAAFKKHPGWNVRSMHVARTYIKYPYDLGWDVELARKLYAEADVVHHQNRLYGYAMYDRGMCKPAVVTHHGPPLRGDADAVNREAMSIGAVQTVSTVDLLDDAPHATWTPCFYDLDWLAKKHPRKPARRLRIGHGPTVREAKGTDAILRAFDHLSRRHDIEIDLQEGMTWSHSLSRKSRCDVYVDQVTLGYGLSAIECMAMGVPVVSGWADPADRTRFLRETGLDDTPFLHATAGDLVTMVEALIRSASLRDEYAQRGRAFVRDFHDEARGVELMKNVYASAGATKGVDALELYGEVPKAQVVRKWAAWAA